jgi:hypothetical protein
VASEKNTKNKERSDGSPPLVTQLTAMIFGDKRPDPYTLITFYINLFFWSCFFLWSVASYLTLSYRDLITEQKKIAVELIIGGRGQELGFQPETFLGRLETLHILQLVILVIVFAGLVLLYRKNIHFIYFTIGGMLTYTGLQIFFIGFRYFAEDITLFDKTAVLTMIASCILYRLMLKREQSGGTIGFFDEEEAVE